MQVAVAVQILCVECVYNFYKFEMAKIRRERLSAYAIASRNFLRKSQEIISKALSVDQLVCIVCMLEMH